MNMTDSETLDFFDENGYCILKNAIPEELILSYENLWIKNHTSGYDVNGDLIIDSLNGWKNSNSFVSYKEIRDILCHENIFNFLNKLNKNFCLHLSFTSWISTQKGWHQDWIKPSKKDANNYVGVWVALEDINPDSGPFQFIPKSHQWEVDFDYIYNQKDRNKVQELLAQQAISENATAYSFIGSRGDLIIWSGHLVHRGSMPIDENILRKSLIGHYDTMDHNIVKYNNGLYRDDKNAGVDLYI